MPQTGFLTEQGLAIRQARLARAMTQSVLAAGAGVSEKTIRRAEAGERLQAESVLAICSVLGLDPKNLRSEAEMNPTADIDRRRQRIRLGVLTAGMALSLVAASVTGVLVARSGGGYKEVSELTIGNPWINAYLLGFGFLNVLPAFAFVRRIVPGADRLNRWIAPLEPYGMAVTFGLAAYIAATLLPFALADGWGALQTGGDGAKVMRGAAALFMTPVAVLGLSSLIAGSDGWNKWAERRLSRGAKPA